MLARLWHRFNQFYSAMFSKYSKTDDAFAASYLNSEEKALFNQLPGFEKKHAVTVARRMLDLALYNPELDPNKLVKLGLLHDIGKITERNSILSKSALVVVRFLAPWFYNWLAEQKKVRKFYLHKHHGREGARLLEKIGESSEFLSVISKHDPRVEPFGPEDPIELKILQQADGY